MKRFRIGVIALIAVFLICSVALAAVPWAKTFKSFYKPKSDTALAKAKCAVCHVKTNGEGGQNAYGKMLEKKKACNDSLKAIEKKDADKDGFTNIDEIKAGTLPGDAKSKPAKKD